MGIKNKFNTFIGKLSNPAYRINAVFFTLLWALYCTISVELSGGICCSGEGIGIFLIPLYLLYYFAIFLFGLTNIISNTVKRKKWHINFRPNIFTIMLLIPQILFTVFLPLNDNTIFGLWGLDNYSHRLLFSFITIISFLTYIFGLIILFRDKPNDKNGIISERLFNRSLRLSPTILTMLGILLFIYTQNPPSPCFLKIDMSDRASCYVESGIAKKDLSICPKIEYRYYNIYIFDCYAGIAAAEKDESICIKIDDQYYKNECYGNLGSIKHDLSICDKISSINSSSLQKDACYMDIGVFEQDFSICDKIQSEYHKKICYRDIKVRQTK